MERIRLERPADLLSAVLELDNLAVTADGAQLVRTDLAMPASVIVWLPAQHYLEAVGHSWIGPVRPGGPSRLEFRFPEGVTQLPLPAGGLFDLLATMPVNPGGSFVEFPAGYRTYAPTETWEEVEQGREIGQHMVWRLRPGAGNDGAAREMRWYGQYELDEDIGDILPDTTFWFEMFRLKASFQASRYALSSLGATIHLAGPLPLGPGPVEYEHHATFGRDTWVQVTTRGRLSTGHRAALVESASRVFVVGGGEETAARAEAQLVKERRLVVTDPNVEIAPWSHAYPQAGREMPFRHLHMVTTSTEVDENDDGRADGRADWVRLHDSDVRFTISAIDWEGRSVTFATPAIFTPDELAGDAALGLFDASDESQRRVDLGGQSLALADPAGRAPGSTTVVTHSALLMLVRAIATEEGIPALLPAVRSASVVLDAVQQFTGQATTTEVSFHPSYLAAGVGAASGNPTGAFLDFQPVSVALAASAVGGLAAPRFSLGAVTTERGVVSSALSLTETPSLADLRAMLIGTKILGVVDLIDLLPDRGLEAPRLLRREDAGAVSFDYELTCPLKELDTGVLRPGKGGGRLSLGASVRRTLQGGGGLGVPTTRVEATLTNFAINIAGIAVLKFASVTVINDNGQKTRIETAGMALEFQGALGFLSEIATRMTSSGLGHASVDVRPDGITAGFAVALPTIQMSVVQLANLSVSATLVVPFTSDPFRFRLDIASKVRPFLATVSIFGGGGYFSMELSSGGIQRLDAAIEFGGSMSLNIVVASGGVYVLAGIYFSHKTVIDGPGLSHAELVLVAFLRCGGHLSVLGIVSVSVEFYMELGYAQVGGHHGLRGRASVTVGIEVLFFSKTVRLEVEREFIGSSADPSFADCVTPDDWDTYCLAFASDIEPEPV